MKTDYKFKSIRRDGQTTKCEVLFYEGDITTERDGIDPNVDITRYRRIKLLEVKSFEYAGDISDEELRKIMNKELKKDTTRDPIKEQTNAEDI